MCALSGLFEFDLGVSLRAAAHFQMSPLSISTGPRGTSPGTVKEESIREFVFENKKALVTGAASGMG